MKTPQSKSTKLDDGWLKLYDIVDGWYHEQTRHHLIDLGDPKPMFSALQALIESKVLEGQVLELKKLPTPKIDEINMWARTKAQMAGSKQQAFIQGARFMRNRVQAYKGERLAALEEKDATKS